MSQEKVKILVACHKPDTVYSDDVYTPIHVGRAISNYKDEMADMIGDDTGDNISEKNPYYCELTAQYWGWKNLDCEYIGLCHYRRYFETIVTEENVDDLLGEKYDIMLVRPMYEKRCVSTRLRLATCTEDYYIFYQCLIKLYPRYKSVVDKFVGSNMVVPFNMFLMKKDLFDKFAEWQFSVLKEMEKYVRLSGYTRCRRLYGYMAEMMLPIYCYQNNLKVRYDEWVPNVGFKSKENNIKRSFYETVFRIMFKIWPDRDDGNWEALHVGLKADGIDI